MLDTPAWGLRFQFWISTATEAGTLNSMKLHPLDLEQRALEAHRRRAGRTSNLSASIEEIGERCYVAVRQHGAAINVYRVQRNQLRRMERIPEPIW